MKPPAVAVDVEDTSAEEIAEDGGEGFAFRVIVEIGFNHVFYVVWICGDDVVEYVKVDCSSG